MVTVLSDSAFVVPASYRPGTERRVRIVWGFVRIWKSQKVGIDVLKVPQNANCRLEIEYSQNIKSCNTTVCA